MRKSAVTFVALSGLVFTTAAPAQAASEAAHPIAKQILKSKVSDNISSMADDNNTLKFTAPTAGEVVKAIIHFKVGEAVDEASSPQGNDWLEAEAPTWVWVEALLDAIEPYMGKNGQFGPEFGPDFGPEFGPEFGPDFGPEFGPDFGPEFGAKVGPEFGPDFEGVETPFDVQASSVIKAVYTYMQGTVDSELNNNSPDAKVMSHHFIYGDIRTKVCVSRTLSMADDMVSDCDASGSRGCYGEAAEIVFSDMSDCFTGPIADEPVK